MPIAPSSSDLGGDPPGDPTSKCLLDAAREGSVDALSTLFESIRGHLRLAAIRGVPRRGGRVASLSDLVQDVMATGYERFCSFRGASEAEFFVWMRTILRSTAIDRFRRRRTIRRYRGQLVKPLHDVGSREQALADDAHERPESLVIRAEDVRSVVGALKSLPPDQHRVLWLHHWEGKAFDEIAVEMERSESAVRKLWCRGLERLETSIRDRASIASTGGGR